MVPVWTYVLQALVDHDRKALSFRSSVPEFSAETARKSRKKGEQILSFPAFSLATARKSRKKQGQVVHFHR